MTIRLRNLSDLYPLISAHAPGYNETSAIRELRRSLQDLCQYAAVSQDTVESSLAIGERTLFYDSPHPSHLVVHRVLSITTPTGQILPKALDEMNEVHGWRTADGTPKWACPESPGELSLYPSAPTAVISPIYIRLALSPKSTTTKIDEDVMDRYSNIIADGALSRILRIGGQKWSNPGESADCQRRFTTACSNARAVGNKTNARTVMRLPIRRQC
ncbi:MAG: hypothetical protein KBF58_10940 [Methyloversatilis sp.]|nr:hypothetical protein [Methyloversatilis sp.]